MTGNELVAFARGKIGTPYVYGMKGKVLTQKTYDRLRILFGPLVWESDAAKIGQVCVDCSGLISWGTGILRNSQGYHDTADAVFPIATIGLAQGAYRHLHRRRKIHRGGRQCLRCANRHCCGQRLYALVPLEGYCL